MWVDGDALTRLSFYSTFATHHSVDMQSPASPSKVRVEPSRPLQRGLSGLTEMASIGKEALRRKRSPLMVSKTMRASEKAAELLFTPPKLSDIAEEFGIFQVSCLSHAPRMSLSLI